MSHFFTDQRIQFFKPLNGKFREQVISCLATFYQRLYGSVADYSSSFNRDQVIEIFEEGITRSPILESDTDDEYTASNKSQREQANWVLNQLLENGWLERHMDEATLVTTYAFSRYGRLFTLPMMETSGKKFRTRNRNTRNTRNALQSFINDGEVYDLLDAFEYSERIVSDFSDVISELDERKRQLVKEVEAQQIIQRAADEFFDFMEQRFMPDLAIRLSADSVEKYQDEIVGLLKKARRKQNDFKVSTEKELRRIAPELIENNKDSVYLMILNGIEARLNSASSIMLPALREALNGFTRRVDLIMRQLNYAGTGARVQLYELCEKLKQAPNNIELNALEKTGQSLSSLNVGFVAQENLQLNAERQARSINSTLDDHDENDKLSRKHMFVASAIDLAFVFNSDTQRKYLIDALCDGHRIHSQNLPVNNAKDLLMSAHIIEVGSSSSSEFIFKVEPTTNRVKTEYFTLTDEFTIELKEIFQNAN